jgi:hypothetical protein
MTPATRWRSTATTVTGPCADLDGPSVTVRAPSQRQKFNGTLLIAASVTDGAGVGVAKVTFKIDGKVIRHWAPDPGPVTNAVIDWQGARNVSPGTHTITVEALDQNRNMGTTSFQVVRVTSLASTLRTSLAPKLSCKRRTCTLKGRLTAPELYSHDGNIKIAWQWKGLGRSYKTIHGGLKKANKPFVFKQKLKRAGRWRVRVTYLGKAPLKKSSSRYVTFKVR